MTRFVIFLRAVNVGGTKLPMAEFRALLETLGYTNVQTYVQSGNALIEINEPARAIESAIHTALVRQYNYNIAVFAFEIYELQQMADANPFCHRSDIDPTKLHVTFLKETPDSTIAIAPELGGTDEWVLIGSTLYLYCPNGYGRTKLTNAYFERKFKTVATTRNWRTIRTLLELAQD